MDTGRIRYAGTYTGPSYGSYDLRGSMEGFTSLADAKDKFLARQETSGGYPLPVIVLDLDRDLVIHAACEKHTRFPATTPEDTLVLYAVTDDGQVSAEPFARLSAGPRGGVVREDF